MDPCYTRRDFLKAAGAASLLAPLASRQLFAAAAKPSSPVSIARCKTYDPDDLFRQVQAMTEQLGGLHKLVNGKTVAVKVNLTGHPKQPALGLPAGRP